MSDYRHHKLTGLSLYFGSQTSVCTPHSAIQLSPGDLNISLWQLSQGGVEISRQVSDRSLYLETTTPSDSVRLLFSSSGDTTSQWRGFNTVEDTILVIPDNFGFYASPESWEDIDIIIPNQIAMDLGIDPYTLHTLTHPLIRSVSAQLRLLFCSYDPEHQESNDWLSRILEQLKECVHHADASKALTPNSRQQLVERALEYVREHQESTPDMTVEQLSKEIGTTGRTLQRAFNDSLGIAPYSFLLNVRLNAARQELIVSQSNSLSVTDLGAEMGFTSTSKFIEHYRRFYNETPSVTLNRNLDKSLNK